MHILFNHSWKREENIEWERFSYKSCRTYVQYYVKIYNAMNESKIDYMSAKSLEAATDA